MNDRQLKELILAAKGKLPFDIYFYNARIVDVYRERIIDSGSVGITPILPSIYFEMPLSVGKVVEWSPPRTIGVTP